MRVDLIELARRVYRIQSMDTLAEMIRDETDVEKASVMSHRLDELREKQNAQADANQP